MAKKCTQQNPSVCSAGIHLWERGTTHQPAVSHQLTSVACGATDGRAPP